MNTNYKKKHGMFFNSAYGDLQNMMDRNSTLIIRMRGAKGNTKLFDRLAARVFGETREEVVNKFKSRVND